MACERLDAAGRSYRLAYASASISGLLAIVRSGQAIAVLTRSAVPPDLQILETGDVLPALPTIGLAGEFSLEPATAMAAAFADHLRATLPTL